MVLAWSGVGLVGLGCPAGDDAETTAASATDPDSSTDPTDTDAEPESTGEPGTSGEPGTTGDPGTSGATDTDGSETTGGELTNCDDATTPEQCNAISNEYADCQWYETTLVADTTTCAATPGAGTCVNHAELDGCANPDHGNYVCEGSEIRWFYAQVDGGWEFFQAEGDICGNVPVEFAECYPDPEMPDVAAGCACACTLE